MGRSDNISRTSWDRFVLACPLVSLFLSSRFSGSQASCQRLTVSGNYSAVEGCYELSSEYESLSRNIYTNDGGDVINGSSLAVLGSFNPRDDDDGATWAIATVFLYDDEDHEGEVYIEKFLCVGGVEYWTTYHPEDIINPWKCDANLDGFFSAAEGINTTCGCEGVADDDDDDDDDYTYGIDDDIEEDSFSTGGEIVETPSSAASSASREIETEPATASTDSSSSVRVVISWTVLALLGACVLGCLLRCTAKSRANSQPRVRTKNSKAITGVNGSATTIESPPEAASHAALPLASTGGLGLPSGQPKVANTLRTSRGF